MKRYVVGLDCGVNTGLAVFDTKTKKFGTIQSFDFWGAYDHIEENFDPDFTIIHVEWLSMTAGLYARSVGGSKMAANVGGVRKETDLMIRGLERLGFEVRKIRPSTKWNQAEFVQITGDTRRTNEHTRDAAKMCLTMR